LKGNCFPVQISLATSSLAKGVYTGTITVSDPNAVDAPQFITITAFVGGNIPDKLEFFAPPGGSASTGFTSGAPVTANISNNTPWLAVAADGAGSFQFNVPVTYRVTATALNGMGAGDYNGSIAISGSSFAPDNKSLPVALHVTTQPILRVNPESLAFRIAQSAAKQTAFAVLANGGQGTLTISNVTAASGSGAWLSAQTISNGQFLSVVADPTGLSPGSYTGTVTVASNAANSSVAVPVQLNVVAQTAPVAVAGGLVNNGTFGGGEPLAQGDIVALFGDQFTYGEPQQATNLPLPTNLADTQVLVNGQAAPVYYVSPAQINFEIPIDAAVGDATVQVVRNGQQGNRAYMLIKDRVPRFILFQGGPYAVMTTPDGTLTGIPTHPVKANDVVVIYTIGLGPTSPSVASGTASPSNPLAIVNAETRVCFGNDSPFSPAPCVTPQFVGLTPGFVGLYQVNVAIPQNLTSGNLPFSFSVSGVASDVVQLAVQ
jgi:adhesin/invasin